MAGGEGDQVPDYIYRHKHSPYWQYDFVLDGQRFSGSTKTEKKPVARRFVQRLRDDIIAGHQGRARLTVGQGSEGYWTQHGQHQRSAGWIDDGLARFNEAIGARRLMRSVGTSDIGNYLAQRRLKVGPATANRDLNIIRALWRFAARRLKADVGEMPDWPALRQVEPAPRKRTLRSPERDKLLGELPPDLALLLAFCLTTGARVSSARALTWSDVDPGTITFREVKSRRSGETHTLRTRAIDAILARVRGQHKSFVFTYICRRSRGKRKAGERYPFSRDGWRKRWSAAREAAGLGDVVFHDSRRTAGVELLRATGNLRLVQQLLGHADIATTARIYTPLLVDDLAAGMAKVSRSIPEKETAPPEGEADKLFRSKRKGSKRR